MPAWVADGKNCRGVAAPQARLGAGLRVYTRDMPGVIVIETALMIVVPVIAGALVLWRAKTTPSLLKSPARTAVMLFVALLVAAAFLSPGGDLITPTIGAMASAAVCATVLLELRRRRTIPS